RQEPRGVDDELKDAPHQRLHRRALVADDATRTHVDDVRGSGERRHDVLRDHREWCAVFSEHVIGSAHVEDVALTDRVHHLRPVWPGPEGHLLLEREALLLGIGKRGLFAGGVDSDDAVAVLHWREPLAQLENVSRVSHGSTSAICSWTGRWVGTNTGSTTTGSPALTAPSTTTRA